MFMSNDELYDLTKKKHKAKAVKYLSDHHIPFEIGGDGRPKVLKAFIDERLGMKGSSKVRKPTEPNFGAFQIIRSRRDGKAAHTR